MADVTIYGIAPSTFTRTARLALEEKGVPYRLEHTPLKSESHLAVQPFGKIPAMRHGDLLLYETSAIARYVDATFDGPALEPRETMARVRCDQLVSIASDYLYESAIRRFVLPTIFPSGPDGKPDMELVGKGRAETAQKLAIVDDLVAESAGSYLVGDSCTLADLFVAPILCWVEKIPGGAELLQAAPRLKACYDAASARPSFAATIPPMPKAA
jgi:glutathione S-transferase